MRLPVLIAALAIATPLGLCAGSASAQFFEGQSVLGGRYNGPQGPWCAHNTNGWDQVDEDCSFASFAACRNAIGNPVNGFCTQNFAGDVRPVRSKKKNRARR